MSKLVIVRGISGSGKSTHAEMLKSQGYKVVSRDAIRIGMFNFEFNPEYEEEVTLIEHAMLNAYLKAGYDVVSDNTNIENKYVKAIAKIGWRHGAEVELKSFDLPLAEAKKRNDKRAALGGRFVPHDVIQKQYERFQKTKNYRLPEVPQVKPYDGTPDKPKAFLVDIDGTLAHMRDYRGPFDWAHVGLDDLDNTVADIVARVGNPDTWMEPLLTIVMSGRDESSRDETERWLTKHGIYWDHLFMRPENDMRPDNIVKAELFDTYVRDNYDVQFVLDDRDQVVQMWRAMGLKCLQVDFGDF